MTGSALSRPTSATSTTWTADATFSGAWRASVRRTPDSMFLIFEGPDGASRAWTYGQFDQLVARTAGFLRSHGVVAGSSVHFALTNSPAFVALWLATTGLGAWIVPSDPAASAPELEGQIKRTAPTIGFCSVDRADVYRAAATAGSITTPFVEIDETDCSLDAFDDEALVDWPVALPGDLAGAERLPSDRTLV